MSETLPLSDARHRTIRLQRPSFPAPAPVPVIDSAQQAQLGAIKKARGERKKKATNKEAEGKTN